MPGFRLRWALSPEVLKSMDFPVRPVYEGLRNATVDEGSSNSFTKLSNTFKNADKPAVFRETVQLALKQAGGGMCLDVLTERMGSLVHDLVLVACRAAGCRPGKGHGANEEVAGRVVLPPWALEVLMTCASAGYHWQ